MNCRAAQPLISAERDGALGGDSRGTLEEHLAGCATCRQLRVTLTESAAAWRTTTARVPVPDERLEWQRIRRRLNGEPARSSYRAWGAVTGWRGLSFGAAAVLALGLFFSPRWPDSALPSAKAQVARSEFVEVGGDASSAMVFVDEKSGWLVVWAAGATGGGG